MQLKQANKLSLEMLLRRGKTRESSASREGLVPLLICMTLESAVEEQNRRYRRDAFNVDFTEFVDLLWWVAIFLFIF